MNTRDLNIRLANAIGFETAPHRIFRRDEINCIMPGGEVMWAFNPAQNRNHLVDHVLPEVERRGLEWAFVRAVYPSLGAENTPIPMPAVWLMMTRSCLVLAVAALKVLEEART